MSGIRLSEWIEECCGCTLGCTSTLSQTASCKSHSKTHTDWVLASSHLVSSFCPRHSRPPTFDHPAGLAFDLRLTLPSPPLPKTCAARSLACLLLPELILANYPTSKVSAARSTVCERGRCTIIRIDVAHPNSCYFPPPLSLSLRSEILGCLPPPPGRWKRFPIC